jgi:acyl carrier protein phosphodiesterase
VRGTEYHKAIDAFTDAHPIVRASRARIDARYRRFSGVLIDIFYDYCLAQRFETYAQTPLAEFTSEFYAAVRAHPLPLPSDARATLDRIVAHDLLGRYARIDGVEDSLRRISVYLARKWGRDFALAEAVAELRTHEAAFAADFAAFFPQLQRHVAELATTD